MTKDYFYDNYRMTDFYDDMYTYTEDLNLWYDFITEKTKLLEIACGSGRMTLPILNKYPNISLTGLDYSQEMLDLLKNKTRNQYPNLRIKNADMRNFDLEEKYDVIIIASNSLNHIETYDDLEMVLSKVGEHLKKDGYLLIDILNPNPKFYIRDENKKYDFQVFKQSKTGRYFSFEESNKYDVANQMNYVRYYFRYCDKDGNSIDSNEYIMDLKVRLYFPQEMDYILEKNNWIIEGKYDWYDKRNFEGKTREQIYILRKKN